MEPKFLLELFGYVGTALVVISMMMKSINKLRILNMCGSVISATYSAICGTWPIVLMNISLIAINSFHLIHDRYKSKREKIENDAQVINSRGAE